MNVDLILLELPLVFFSLLYFRGDGQNIWITSKGKYMLSYTYFFMMISFKALEKF